MCALAVAQYLIRYPPEIDIRTRFRFKGAELCCAI
jgi:hypothetical protein